MTPAETTSILTWWLAGGLFLAGLILGALIYAVISRRLPQSDTRSTTTEQQLNNYRVSVLKHFDETSALVQQLGIDYQNLVEKISQNMHELGTAADGKPLLPPIFPATKAAIKNHEHRIMPKTYVDPKNQHKD